MNIDKISKNSFRKIEIKKAKKTSFLVVRSYLSVVGFTIMHVLSALLLAFIFNFPMDFSYVVMISLSGFLLNLVSCLIFKKI